MMNQNDTLAMQRGRAPEQVEQVGLGTSKPTIRLKVEPLEQRIAPAAKLVLAPPVNP